jgi:hypothetical protein
MRSCWIMAISTSNPEVGSEQIAVNGRAREVASLMSVRPPGDDADARGRRRKGRIAQ